MIKPSPRSTIRGTKARASAAALIVTGSTTALARTVDGFALKNVTLDISGTVLLAADSPIEKVFIWTLRNGGIDHVMLGSDYPQISLARTVEALEKLDLTREEKMAILSGNARRILGRGNGS